MRGLPLDMTCYDYRIPMYWSHLRANTFQLELSQLMR